MAKIKHKDVEYEVPDGIVELLQDETGVPFRNRAAEHRRKLDKASEELEALRAAHESNPAPAPPANLSEPVLEYVQPNPYAVRAPQVDAASLEQTVERAVQKQRLQDEYVGEARKLREEWPAYEDEKDKLNDFLRTKFGYDDSTLREIHKYPRDVRVYRAAMVGEVEGRKRSRRPVPSLVLENEGDLEPVGNEWSPEKVASMSKDALRETVERTLLKPRPDAE